MLISKKYRFIFIHIYKNAGTSITDALLPFATSKWQKQVNKILMRLNIKYFEPQPFPSHINALELIKEIGMKTYKSYFTFAFVRNPWDWQVSLYSYMLKNPEQPQHDLVKGLGSFEKYIIWRCSEEIRFQKDFLYSRNGELLVDFIGKFENLENDFIKVCSRTGISASLPKLNVSNKEPYQSFYNKTTEELVREAFTPDIDLFDYDFQ